VYKVCYEPIISLGIILYRKKQLEDGIEYLMVRRKDSLGFVELIRGNYPLDDLPYLINIVDEMTLAEKEAVLTQPFDTLWNNLWLEDEQKKAKYKSEFNKSKSNFEKVKTNQNFDGIITNLDKIIQQSKSVWSEPEWGFPKGRRNLRERDLACAIREFEEETNISRDKIEINRSIPPLVEEFVGSNNKRYRHIYYLARLVDDVTLEINQDKKSQMIEIGDIRWFSLSDALKNIRSYNTEKKNTLREAHSIILHEVENMT
jgi:8-oxo-dGTP pyrophosphatase MutT (NUDIX family)